MKKVKEEIDKIRRKVPSFREMLMWNTYRRIARKLISLKGNPHKLAFSAALGAFIGLFIPMGLQTVFVIPLSLLTEANLILSYLATFVSNPLTAAPIYYAAFSLGESITGKELTWNKISETISHPTISNIFSLGGDGALIFFTGALVIGIVFSSLTYLVTLKTITAHRKKVSV